MRRLPRPISHPSNDGARIFVALALLTALSAALVAFALIAWSAF